MAFIVYLKKQIKNEISFITNTDVTKLTVQSLDINNGLLI